MRPPAADALTTLHRSDLPTVADVRIVRRKVAAWALRNGVTADCSDMVVLVASELVTNAINHARSRFEVLIGLSDGSVELCVYDADSRLPAPAEIDTDSLSGRGIEIVAALADEWGANAAEIGGVAGKVVWVRFRMEPPPAAG